MTLWHLILALVTFAFVAGVVLIVLGLRGKRTDDHPLCRRCRFDLTGMPPTSTRCPECGADVSTPRSRVTGHRRRRVGLILAGVALVLLTLAPAGVWVAIAARDPDWRTRMPDWYELAEARGTLPTDRAAAIDEMLRRDAAGRLDAATWVKLADTILICQADASLPWNNAWGDWFATHVDADDLPRDRQSLYATNAVRQWKFDVRARVRQGDVLGMRCTFAMPRLMRTASWMHFAIKGADRQLWIDGQPIDGVLELFNGVSSWPEFRDVTSVGCPHIAALATLALGTHTLEWRTHVVITSGRTWGETGERVVADVPLTHAFPLTVLPPDAHDVAHVRDHAMRPAITAAIGRVRFVTAKRPGPWIVLSIDFKATLPRTVGFEAIVRQNGKEFPIACFVRRAGAAAEKLLLHADLLTGETPRPGKADLILRPSDDAATRTVDVTEIWDDGDVVIEGVEVE